MKPFRTATFLALAGVVLTLCACTSDEYSVILRGITPPDRADCSYKPAGDNALFTTMGAIDLSLPAGRYVAGVQVSNFIVMSTPNTQMMTQSAMPDLHLNASDIIPRYVHARMRAPKEDGTGAAFGDYQWTVELSGMVIPAGAGPSAPGSGALAVELIPNSVLSDKIAMDGNIPLAPGDPDARVIVDFYLQFDTGSGSTVYSSNLSFALKICFGCLNGFAGLDPTTCTTGKYINPYTTDQVCLPGQDEPVACDSGT